MTGKEESRLLNLYAAYSPSDLIERITFLIESFPQDDPESDSLKIILANVLKFLSNYDERYVITFKIDEAAQMIYPIATLNLLLMF